MPTEPQPPTVARVVHRAVEVCDPEGGSEALADLLVRFEDRDEPVTGAALLESDVDEAVGAIDPDGTDPDVQMARAVVLYLMHRRDELDDDRESILRLTARAEFDGSPPEPIAQWLDAEGVAV